jgi:hypothetical protein
MNEDKSSAVPESHLLNEDPIPARRGLTPGSERQSRPDTAEPKRVEIVLRIAPAQTPPSVTPTRVVEVAPGLVSAAPGAIEPAPTRRPDNLSRPEEARMGEGAPLLRELSAEPIANLKSRIANDMVPARMLNEFVYCQRDRGLVQRAGGLSGRLQSWCPQRG